MSYQVLARKWRPQNFTEMVGQEHVLKALSNALDQERLHHAYLFTGTRGVGKTTVARIFAKSLNCETGVTSTPCGQCAACLEIAEGRFVDLIEIDAASRTKVEDMRELLDNVQYAPTKSRYKVYLIDEVHMLSNSSFNALLKTLEEPPPHIKFLLATTDPQKLPVTILSRCLQFSLKNLSPERIVKHLDFVLQSEQVPSEESALWELAKAAEGSMRDALSLTDQAIAFGNGNIRCHDVLEMLGTIEKHVVLELVQLLSQSKAAALLAKVAHMAEFSPDYAFILQSMSELLHRVAIEQAVPGAIDNSFGDQQAVTELAQAMTAEDTQLFYQIALTSRKDLTLAPDPRVGFEMALLRMLSFRPNIKSADELDVPPTTPVERVSDASEHSSGAPQGISGAPQGISGAPQAIEEASADQPSRPESNYSDKTNVGLASQSDNQGSSTAATNHSGSQPGVIDPQRKDDVNKTAQMPAENHIESRAERTGTPSGDVQNQPVKADLSDAPPAYLTEGPPPFPPDEPPADYPEAQYPGILQEAESQPVQDVKQENVQAHITQSHQPESLGSHAPQQIEAKKKAAVEQGNDLSRSSVPGSGSGNVIATSNQAPFSQSSVTQTQVSASKVPASSSMDNEPEDLGEDDITDMPVEVTDLDVEQLGLGSTTSASGEPMLQGQCWSDIVKKIKLAGMTLTLAQRCILQDALGQRLDFVIDEDHFDFFNELQVNRLSQALTDFLRKEVTINVKSGTSPWLSPLQKIEKKRAELQVEAEREIAADQNVQSLIQNFGATIVSGSIEPILKG